MRIDYNEETNTIKINDKLKINYLLMDLSMFLNIVNAIINLYDVNRTGFGFSEILWLVVGIISLVILIYFSLKKSLKNELALDEIRSLKKYGLFGKKNYFLQLKNGMQRDLIYFTDEEEMEKIKSMFSEIGLAVTNS